MRLTDHHQYFRVMGLVTCQTCSHTSLEDEEINFKLDNLFIIWIKQILKLVVVTSIIGFGAYQLDQQHQCYCFVIYSRIWCISIKSTSMLLFFHCWMKVMKSKDDVRFVCKSPNTFATCLSCDPLIESLC
jgi:hypothetical protein